MLLSEYKSRRRRLHCRCRHRCRRHHRRCRFHYPHCGNTVPVSPVPLPRLAMSACCRANITGATSYFAMFASPSASLTDATSYFCHVCNSPCQFHQCQFLLLVCLHLPVPLSPVLLFTSAISTSPSASLTGATS